MRPDDAKLRALAEFAAGAGHEINNPVATIAGHVQRLLRGEADPDRRQALLTIGAQAYRIRDMIADTMLFARPPAPDFQDVDLAQIVVDVVGRIAREHDGHSFDVAAPQSARVRADATQAAVVLSELLRNSVQATAPPATIHVRLDPPDEGHVRLSVEDSGKGLTDLEREHLFDPFFSGRQAGRGLGFGLCKCWRIVTLHGGRIEAVSAEGRTTFTTWWPV